MGLLTKINTCQGCAPSADSRGMLFQLSEASTPVGCGPMSLQPLPPKSHLLLPPCFTSEDPILHNPLLTSKSLIELWLQNPFYQVRHHINTFQRLGCGHEWWWLSCYPEFFPIPFYFTRDTANIFVHVYMHWLFPEEKILSHVAWNGCPSGPSMEICEHLVFPDPPCLTWFGQL